MTDNSVDGDARGGAHDPDEPHRPRCELPRGGSGGQLT